MDSQLRSEVIFRADIAQMLTAILSAAAGSDAVYNFGFFSAIRAVSIAYDVQIPGLDEERERLALAITGGGGND